MTDDRKSSSAWRDAANEPREGLQCGVQNDAKRDGEVRREGACQSEARSCGLRPPGRCESTRVSRDSKHTKVGSDSR